MADTKKGLLMVFTGNGKGKTTSALGLTFRALGHGHKVCFIQFIKGSWKYGELEAAKRFDDLLDFHVMGRGFTWKSDNLEKEMKRYIRIISGILVTGFIATIIIGCAQKIQPKGWLSVEKPPMRVILVDNEKDINQNMVHMVIGHVAMEKYKDYKFNDKAEISVYPFCGLYRLFLQ